MADKRLSGIALWLCEYDKLYSAENGSNNIEIQYVTSSVLVRRGESGALESDCKQTNIISGAAEGSQK